MALKKKVNSNISVVKKNSDKTETVLKDGVHVGLPEKVGSKSIPKTSPIIGLSIGGTFNLENYESLRVDVWLSDTVKDGETVEEAYTRVKEVISKQFVEAVTEFKEQ